MPVGRRREAPDFMINGSCSRWMKAFGNREVGFVSIGFASGSLYHEAFGRIGVRRVSLAEVLEPAIGASPAWQEFSRYVRFSGGRGSTAGCSAVQRMGIPCFPSSMFSGRSAVSLASYGDGTAVPDWELEFVATIDSGLFPASTGRSIERRFGSIALRFSPMGCWRRGTICWVARTAAQHMGFK